MKDFQATENAEAITVGGGGHLSEDVVDGTVYHQKNRFGKGVIDEFYKGANPYEPFDPFPLSENWGKEKKGNTPSHAMHFPGDQQFENPILRNSSQLYHTLNKENDRNPNAETYGHILGEGTCHEDVIALRQALLALYPDWEDCIDNCATCIDAELMQLIKQFQSDQKIKADGLIGPETLSKLDKALMKKNVTTYDWGTNNRYGEVRQMSAAEQNYYSFVGDEFHRPRQATVRSKVSKGSSLLNTPNYADVSQKTNYVVMPGDPVIITASSADHSKNYFYASVKDRTNPNVTYQGWLSGDHIQFRHFDNTQSSIYTVKDKDTLGGIVDREYGELIAQGTVSRQDAAAAVYMTNQDKYVVYLTDPENPNQRDTKGIDPWQDTEDFWNRVGVTSGFELELPKASTVIALRATYRNYGFTEFLDDLMYASQGILGFIEGFGEGFVDAGKGMFEDLWGMVSSILTGEIFGQIKQFYDAISNLTWDDFKELALNLLNTSVDEIQKIWNSNDPFEKWNFFGKITGALVFEVVVASLTGGGAIAAKLGKMGKLGKLMSDLSTGKSFKKLQEKTGNSLRRKMSEYTLKRKQERYSKEIGERKKNNPEFNKDADEVLKDSDLSSIGNKGEELAKKKGRDLDSEAQAEVDKSENKKEHDESERKELKKAVKRAKAITLADDEAGVSLEGLMTHLKPLGRIKGVKYFDSVRASDNAYDIFLIGSKFNVGKNFTQGYDPITQERVDDSKVPRAPILNPKLRAAIQKIGTDKSDCIMKVLKHYEVHDLAQLKKLLADEKFDFKYDKSLSDVEMDRIDDAADAILEDNSKELHDAFKELKGANDELCMFESDGDQLWMHGKNREFHESHETVTISKSGKIPKLDDGRYDFVLTESGDIKIGTGHFFLSDQAKYVSSAGDILVKDGKIVEITNISGHYKPREVDLERGIKKFSEHEMFGGEYTTKIIED